jgi:hypothetical protein
VPVAGAEAVADGVISSLATEVTAEATKAPAEASGEATVPAGGEDKEAAAKAQSLSRISDKDLRTFLVQQLSKRKSL